jgi:hypothetical protein
MQKRITWRFAATRRLDEPRRRAAVAPHYDACRAMRAVDQEDSRHPALIVTEPWLGYRSHQG